MAVKDWSSTAASNTSILSGITLDGSVMTVPQIDNAFREMAAQIAAQLGKMGFEGADIASAATINLANATGWSLDITGSTGPVTSFGTVDAGQMFMLRFVSTPTLTHNATSLILPGSANITATAGDIAFMKSEGSGNWRCVNYMRASGVPVGYPTSSTDNVMTRFDGTGGKIQTTGVTVDDSNNMSGIGTISSGAITSSGAISGTNGTLSGTLGVTGATTLSSTLAVTGAATLSSTLSVTGAITSGSGASSIGGTLTVTGLATFNGGSGVVVTNALSVGTTLSVTGAATAASFSGVGTSLTSLNASNLASGTVASARVSGSYTGITGTGALNAGSITSGFGSINIGSSALTAGAGSLTTLTTTGNVSVGGDIDATGDVNTADDFNAGTYSGTGASAGVFVGNDGVINLSSTGTGSHQKAGFVNANGGVGSIVTSGAGTTYNTSSDARKKRNFRPFDSGHLVDALQFGKFDWISDGTIGYGVLAQDVEPIFPNAITLNNEGWYEADYSKFVPIAMAELKAIRGRVAMLEAHSNH